MTKSMKRIHKVMIKRTVDDSPDTSWLGKYSNNATSVFSIDREHDTDCATQTYNNFHPDVDADDPECNCSRGSRGRNEYQYFNPSFNYVDKADNPQEGLTVEDVIKYTIQDYERLESLNAGHWYFLGISAEAEIQLAAPIGVYANSGKPVYTIQSITSGGLWGIESDSDSSYFTEVEQEQLHELRDQLHAIGFSNRAISSAFKTIEREGL